ncbi:flagellar hook-length control protein FliK [Novosphingobium sp. YJ-S2-02]|uniref:Flagellar hook-length control protein FliK n=1 Tax=Novosphingobium aureum TaxID=2792964 RepID=A0A931H9P0_9SPHN|nr:flagellar hook-length control protein FliK [Novosphingobium aureum]MBH0111942.1 flagellar hook-length control protein FliK [Novosphingobium aureum]
MSFPLGPLPQLSPAGAALAGGGAGASADEAAPGFGAMLGGPAQQPQSGSGDNPQDDGQGLAIRPEHARPKSPKADRKMEIPQGSALAVLPSGQAKVAQLSLASAAGSATMAAAADDASGDSDVALEAEAVRTREAALAVAREGKAAEPAKTEARAASVPREPQELLAGDDEAQDPQESSFDENKPQAALAAFVAPVPAEVPAPAAMATGASRLALASATAGGHLAGQIPGAALAGPGLETAADAGGQETAGDEGGDDESAGDDLAFASQLRRTGVGSGRAQASRGASSASSAASESATPKAAERQGGQTLAASGEAAGTLEGASAQTRGDTSGLPSAIQSQALAGNGPVSRGGVLPYAPASQTGQAHSAQVSVQPGQFGTDIGVQISRALDKGSEDLLVRLDPRHMGRIDVRLSFDHDGMLRATVSADSAAAADLLRRESTDLNRALADAGVRADGQSLRFDTRAGGQGGQGQQAQSQHGQGQQGQGQGHPAFAANQFGTSEEQAYQPLSSSGRVDLMA